MLIYDILGDQACSTHDLLQVSGVFDAGGASIQIMNYDFNPIEGAIFPIVQSGSFIGSFDSANLHSAEHFYSLDLNNNELRLISLAAFKIDFAIYELGCGSFEVRLKPNHNVELDGSPELTNLQFTLKYPATSGTMSFVPENPYALVVGQQVTYESAFRMATFFAVDIPGTEWLANEEYVVLRFSHNQEGSGTGNLLFVEDSDPYIAYAANAGYSVERYAEYLGADVTGLVYHVPSASSFDACPVWNETQDRFYYTLADALTDPVLQPNDEIRLNKAGVYPASSLAVETAGLRIYAEEEGFVFDGGNQADQVLWIKADGIQLEGFEVRNAGDDPGAVGILIDEVDDCVLNNLTLDQNQNGVLIQGGQNHSINACTFSSNSQVGLELNSTSGSQLDCSIFDQNGKVGLKLVFASNINIAGNRFQGHIGSLDEDGIAIALMVSSNNIIQNNRFESNEIGMHYTGVLSNYSNSNVVSSNFFDDNLAHVEVTDNGSANVVVTCNYWNDSNPNVTDSKLIGGNIIWSPRLVSSDELSLEELPEEACSTGFYPSGLCRTPLQLKLFLQANFDPAVNEMHTLLASAGVVPLSQPYNTEPWNYNGSESFEELPTDAVDWVLVELRSDDTEAYQVIDRSAGMLLKDGTVSVSLDAEAIKDFFLVVYHRNHLPLMSRELLSPEEIFPFDFTQLSSCYGPQLTPPVSPGMILTEQPEQIGMIAGNTNQNNELKYSGLGNDRGEILTQITNLTSSSDLNTVYTDGGYFAEDVLLNNDLRYSGALNDRAIILSNLSALSGTALLNAIYTSPVPFQNQSKSWSEPDGPIRIRLVDNRIELTTNIPIRNGKLDNLQFSLSLPSDRALPLSELETYTSQFGLSRQDAVYQSNMRPYITFVSVQLTDLPENWLPNEPLVVAAFEANIQSLGLQLANAEEVRHFNGDYYVSLYGKNVTGGIIQPEQEMPTDPFEDMKVFPNPSATGVINIVLPELSHPGSVKLELFDMAGVRVWSKSQNEGSKYLRINFATLRPGVYNLQIITPERTLKKQLVLTNH